MSNVRERLQEYLKFKGYTQSYFCRKIGVSSAYVASIARSIPDDKILIIKEQFGDLNTDWLLYNKGTMLMEGEQKDPNTSCSIPDLFAVIQSQQNTIESLSKALQNAVNTINEIQISSKRLRVDVAVA